MEFKNANNVKIANIATYIKEYFFNADINEPHVLWIGCDSTYKGKKHSEYAVAVCIYKWGRGCHVVHKKYTFKTTSIQDRLWKEVELCVEVAEFLKKENVFIQKSITRDKRSLMPQEIFYGYAKPGTFAEWETKQQYIPNLKNCIDFRIDIDFNSKVTDHKGKPLESNKLHDSAIYYVEGMGYQCVAKPDAFAATYAADKLLK